MKIGEKKINPTKIICLGRNYMDHIKEMESDVPQEPVLFPKTLNCLITDNDPIIYPKFLYQDKELNRVDHEVELAFIIKDKCKNVKEKEAYSHILGFTVFLDITARKMQRSDISQKLPWFRSKSLDTFGPIGPKIVPLESIKNPHNLDITLKVNEELRQSSNTKYLIFKIPYLVAYISKYFTLEPGDIIATGTPDGVGPIQPGDIITASIEKIGLITHEVILEK